MLKYEIIDNNKESWVVFVHGLGGSTKTWKKQIEAFSEQYNLLLLDLPGHGLNANNVIHEVEALRLYDGIKATLDFLNIKNAHFVGLSLGTIVIVNFAIYYPEYIKSVILGGSALLFHRVTKIAICKGLICRDDPAMAAFAYTSPISALIHQCDREPEKMEETMEQIKAFTRHFIKMYGVK